jgi:hypothetical protein
MGGESLAGCRRFVKLIGTPFGAADSMSTGDGFNQVFTTIGFRNDVGNSDRICVKIVKQGFTVFAQQKSPVTLASSQVYWRKFYFYFSIIVTGRKCCCADT